MSKFKIGDIVRRTHDDWKDMPVGATDTVVGVRGSTIDLEKYGTGHADHKLELAQPLLAILDDAGRAALKAGDEVLVRCRISKNIDHDGEFQTMDPRCTTTGIASYFAPPVVYALLPKDATPIAIGDKLRGMDNLLAIYTCIGHTSDGKVVVEYDAGSETNVIARDASCFEHVS